MGTNKKISTILKILIFFSIPLLAVIGPVYKIQLFVTSLYVPLLFIISFISSKNAHFLHYKPVLLYFLFFFLTLLSFIPATDTDAFLGELKTQIGSIIFGLTLFNFAITNPEYIKYVFFSCIFATYIFAIYLFNQGFLSVSLVNEARYRIEDETFNANLFPYYIFLASFSFFFLFHIYKSKVLKYLYFISIPLYTLIIFSSASRGGLLIFIFINAVYWLYVGSSKAPNFVKSTFIAIGIFLLSLPLLSYAAYYIIENTNMGQRFNSLAEEGDETIRVVLVKLAFQKFLEFPILGVGSGNFRTLNRYGLFSHNNFMEILVNNGIISFLAYISIFVVLFQNAFFIQKRAQSIQHKKISILAMLFILSFFGYSFFYVFMNVIPFTGFIFTVFAIIYIFRYNLLTKNNTSF